MFVFFLTLPHAYFVPRTKSIDLKIIRPLQLNKNENYIKFNYSVRYGLSFNLVFEWENWLEFKKKLVELLIYVFF